MDKTLVAVLVMGDMRNSIFELCIKGESESLLGEPCAEFLSKMSASETAQLECFVWSAGAARHESGRRFVEARLLLAFRSIPFSSGRLFPASLRLFTRPFFLFHFAVYRSRWA